MYLGLFLTGRSEDALRSCFEQELDKNLHLTIIHTAKENKVEQPNNKDFDTFIPQTTFEIGSFAKFGKDKDMWVVRVVDTDGWLKSTRYHIQKWFEKNHYEYSDDYSFSPHITLTKAPTLTLKKPLPVSLTFNPLANWVY